MNKANGLNVINFYLELNDNMSNKLKELKGDFKDMFDDVTNIAEQMVTSVEKAFAGIDLKALKVQLSATIKSLRDNARKRVPIKIPATVDLTGAITGTALGVALGNALTNVKLPEQTIAATLRPRLGKRTVTNEAMKEIRSRMVEWFSREENAIPIRYSTKLGPKAFGGKGGIAALRKNLVDAIKPLKLDFSADIEKFQADVVSSIKTGVGPALMEASQAAADVFVQTIMAGLSIAPHGPPAMGPTGPLHYAEFGFPAGLKGPQAKAAQALVERMDPTKFREAAEAYRAEEDPQKAVKTFARIMGGRSIGGKFIEQATLKLHELGSVGEISALKQAGRTPEEQQGVVAKFFGMLPKIFPGAAEGAEIPKSIDEVLIRAHGGEAILPYAKAEESIEGIIRRALERGEFAPKASLMNRPISELFGKNLKVELVISPDVQAVFRELTDALVKGSPEQQKEIREQIDLLMSAHQALDDMAMSVKKYGYVQSTDLISGATSYLASAEDITDAINHQKKVVDDLTASVETLKKAYYTFTPAVEDEIRNLMRAGGADWRKVPKGIVHPEMKGVSPEAQTAALSMMSLQSLAQTGGAPGGVLNYGEVAATMKAASEAGGNWVAVGDLIRATSFGAERGVEAFNVSLGAYRSIMANANIETEAGARAFSTARTAVINLTKRLKAHQKVVEKEAGAYSNVNLQLNEMIDRSSGVVDEMDDMRRSQERSGSEAGRMSLSFRGLISEAKKLVPLMLTIAGAKISAKIDTALMSTREQLVNNTTAWEQYRDIATDVMAETGLAIDDVGKIMTVAARRGFESRAEIEQFAHTVGIIAVSAKGMDADVESATSMAAYNFKRLGIEVSDMGAAFSRLIQSSREGSLSMSDLNTVIGSNIEWLQVTGETSEQATRRMARFAGAAQVLSESFGTAAQGAGAVNELMQVVTALADPAQYGGPIAAGMTTLLQYAGVSFDELMRKVKSRDFASVVRDLTFALEKIPPNQINQFGTAIEGLIGVSRETIMQIKMDPGVTKRLEQTLAAIDMAGMSTDEMVESMNRYNLGLEQSITILKGQFQAAVDDTFGTAKEWLTVIVQKVAMLLHHFNQLPAPVKEITGILVAVGSLAMLAGVIGKMIISLQLVAAALKAAVAGQAGAAALGKGAGAVGAAGFFGKNAAGMAVGGKALAGLLGTGVVAGILAAGAISIGSIVGDLITGKLDSSKGYTANLVKSMGLEFYEKRANREAELAERVRKRQLSHDEVMRRISIRATNAQERAADAQNNAAAAMQQEEEEPGREAFVTAVQRRFDEMTRAWRRAAEVGEEMREVTVMTGRYAGERRMVPLREMHSETGRIADAVVRAMAEYEVSMTQDQAVVEMRRRLTELSQGTPLPEGLSEDAADQFIERFIQDYMNVAAEEMPSALGVAQSALERTQWMAQFLMGQGGVQYREFGQEQLQLATGVQQYAVPGEGLVEERILMARALLRAVSDLESSVGAFSSAGALSLEYLELLNTAYTAERGLLAEEIYDLRQTTDRSTEEQNQLDAFTARFTALERELGVTESLLDLFRDAATDEERAYQTAQLELIAQRFSEMEAYQHIATGREADFEERQRLFMRAVREWAEAHSQGIGYEVSDQAQDLMSQLRGGWHGPVSEEPGAEFRAGIERLLGEYQTPRTAVEDWLRSWTGRELAEMMGEEQEERDKSIIRELQDYDRRMAGKPEKPSIIAPTSETGTVPGKDERLVVVSDSPATVGILKEIVSVLQEIRDKERSEIRNKGNPFLRKALLGIG